MFLMSDMDDLDGALAQFNIVDKLDPNAPIVQTAKAMTLVRLGRLEDAAEIHELLLPSIKNRERRWRLTGADQAADCYRRLTYRAWDKKEYELAKSHTKRALSILLEAAMRSDIDEKLMRRVAMVINEGLSKRELINDQDFIENVVASSEKISDLSHGASIPIYSEANKALLNFAQNDSFYRRLSLLDKSNENRSLLANNTSNNLQEPQFRIDENRRHGKVCNIADTSRYGFIEDSTGERWFFHMNFLETDNDRSRCEIGASVSFRVGQNNNGPCAIEVSLTN
jgi:cold shock CspA family protein